MYGLGHGLGHGLTPTMMRLLNRLTREQLSADASSDADGLHQCGNRQRSDWADSSGQRAAGNRQWAGRYVEVRRCVPQLSMVGCVREDFRPTSGSLSVMCP
jgi:hypothetical protein